MQREIFNFKKLFGNILILIVNFILIASQLSCKKFIEVDTPSTSLNGVNVFTNDATAAAVLTDIYAELSAQNIAFVTSNITSSSLLLSLSADELSLYDLNWKDLKTYYRNEPNTATQTNYWAGIYPQIFATNNAIAGLNSSTSLTPAIKQQLIGEAKFLRAFFYFYLVNIYGDVPLVLDLNYKVNALLVRAPQIQVYQQIINDLKEAETLLSENYLKGDASDAYAMGAEERVRPTKWAAQSLLARVYLYTQDYVNAEAEATKAIENVSLFGLESLGNTFLKNNKEAIWQLQPVGNDANANTGEGKFFVLPEEGPNSNLNPVYLSDNIVNAFEPDDLRRKNWIDSAIVDGTIYYYAYKYKIGNVIAPTTEYPTILRLAEQYLIRAEARAKQNNIEGARQDIDVIRSRASLSGTTANDQTSLITAILHERQVELFTEWGHRWFDLKRTGNIDSVMSVITLTKGGTWTPYKALFPIPQDDINKDPNLNQNPGYN